MTELEAAKLISEGKLPSPHKFSNMTLFAVRVTGTGMAYRNSLDEFVWRDPSLYLNEEFLARVAGLPLIWEHPIEGSLNSKEFGKRIIGTCMFGYIHGDNEVWTVARVYDDEAIKLMTDGQLSTSPGVVFTPEDGNVSGTTSEGETLLIEGRPSTLCHLAVVENGVWDKSKDPAGVQNDLINTLTEEGTGNMAEHEEKADAGNRHDASEKLDAIMDAFKKMDARLDAMEKERADAKADAAKRKDEEEMMDAKKADAASCDEKEEKKDASEDKEEEKEEKEEEKEEEKADKKDSKKDSKKDAKKDSSEEEEKEEKKEDSRKDSAMRAENESLKARLAKLEKMMTTETPGSERDALASAQSRADSVMAMLGDRAPAPLPGEQSLDYRRRLLKRLAPHSPTLKNSRFDSADEGQIRLFEDRVYADAANSARSVADAAPGVLVPYEERDRAGRVITKYHGDIGAFMAPFMTGATVGRINRKPGA